MGFYTTQWRNGRSSGVLPDEHLGSFAGVGGANVELACGGAWGLGRSGSGVKEYYVQACETFLRPPEN